MEAAEERALADPGRRGDLVHGHRGDAVLADEGTGGVEHPSTVAGRVGSLGSGGLAELDRLLRFLVRHLVRLLGISWSRNKRTAVRCCRRCHSGL
jgi:hypothetical protein